MYTNVSESLAWGQHPDSVVHCGIKGEHTGDEKLNCREHLFSPARGDDMLVIEQQWRGDGKAAPTGFHPFFNHKRRNNALFTMSPLSVWIRFHDRIHDSLTPVDPEPPVVPGTWLEHGPGLGSDASRGDDNPPSLLLTLSSYPYTPFYFQCDGLHTHTHTHRYGCSPYPSAPPPPYLSSSVSL